MEGRYWHIAPIVAVQKEISQTTLGNFANGWPEHAASIAALASVVLTLHGIGTAQKSGAASARTRQRRFPMRIAFPRTQ